MTPGPLNRPQKPFPAFQMQSSNLYAVKEVTKASGLENFVAEHRRRLIAVPYQVTSGFVGAKEISVKNLVASSRSRGTGVVEAFLRGQFARSGCNLRKSSISSGKATRRSHSYSCVNLENSSKDVFARSKVSSRAWSLAKSLSTAGMLSFKVYNSLHTAVLAEAMRALKEDAVASTGVSERMLATRCLNVSTNKWLHGILKTRRFRTAGMVAKTR